MGYLAAAKRDGEFNTLAFLNKAPDMLHFEAHVVHGSPRAHLHFLDHVGAGMPLRVVLFLFERVPVFVKIGDAADRGLGGRRYLDQVQPSAFRDAQGLSDRQDADL